MHKRYFWGAWLILPFLLSSCAAQKNNPPLKATLSEATPMNTNTPPLALTEEQNGGTVALMVGDLVRVQLEGNPTTGFTWETENLDANLFEPIGEPEFTRNNNLVGGGGVFIFTFKTLKAGNTHLRLIYHRTFEKDTPPAQIFDVTADIQN